MELLKFIMKEPIQFSADLSAAVVVVLSTAAFYLWVHFGPTLGYLDNLVYDIVNPTIEGAILLLALRLLARATAVYYPSRFRIVHRLAALSNRTLMFGVLPLAATGVALLEFAGLQGVNIYLVQLGTIVLIALVQSLRKAPFLPEFMPADWSATMTTAAEPVVIFEDKPDSMVALAGYLALTLVGIIAGEAVANQFVPWSTYPLGTIAGEGIQHLLLDGYELAGLPDSLVRMRTTLTRRELEIERGSALLTVETFEAKPNERRQRLMVRAGEASVKLPPPRRGQRDMRSVIFVQRHHAKTDVLVREGPAVVLETPFPERRTSLTSWWHRSRALKVGEWATVTSDQTQVQVITAEEADKRLARVNGTLIFNGEPLAEAVDTIYELSGRRLEVEDSTIAKMPVQGQFRLDWPHLADRFVLALEQAGKARQVPGTIFGSIGLIAFDAYPTLYGSAQVQTTLDVCASYRTVHELPSFTLDGADPDPYADFDIAGCDLATSLDIFTEQTTFKREIVSAPDHPIFTQPLKGRYRITEALARMLAGTGCTAAGTASEGWKITCAGTQRTLALNNVQAAHDGQPHRVGIRTAGPSPLQIAWSAGK